jgi:poly(3-hydroxybutyrate) depolymerase
LPGFPHQIDIYKPASPNKAVVFLHGGGGKKHEIAFFLGLNGILAPPTSASVNWDWLNQNRMLAVFAQGQAIPAVPLSYTWNNHVMDSGQDDVAFLQALAGYIKSQYGLSDIYLAGHSNGGMMANRMWCESPDTFKAYISLAGPASSDYLSPATPCEPTSTKPYYGIVGGQDDVLQVTGNWEAPTWVINPFLINSAFVNPVLSGEWNQHQIRSELMCAEQPILADKVSNGTVETWSNCGGRLKLQQILPAGHVIESLETESGNRMIDLMAGFIDDVYVP